MKKRLEIINKKGQVTVYIIVAILIVLIIAGFVFFRGSFSVSDNVPAFAEPVYRNFLSCVDNEALVGIDLLETQAGYIELPEFEPGSPYMPFSSELNFLGNPIPYWYYVSGNNLVRENIPTKEDMEDQLSEYLKENLNDCDFESFYDEGYEITLFEPEVSTNIRGNEVEVEIKMDLGISKNNESVMVRTHNVNVKSKLGELYDAALEVYEYEQENLFLEEYGVDVLRLYAPVDGVEVTCSPKIWNAEEVFDDLEEAIEANTLTIKSASNDFDLLEDNRKYFVVDFPVDKEVRFLNFKDWPNTFEVEPSEGSSLISKPVGTQSGLGVLGFCYVPYHYVYNLRYPVLVQVEDGDETFQFPLAVIIEGNLPREASPGTAFDSQKPPICDYMNTPYEINVIDTRFNSLDAEISYNCFGVSCDAGFAENGNLKTFLPQCVNGFVVARAEGYEELKLQTTTINPGSVDLILNKLHEVDVELFFDGKVYNGNAIVTFAKENISRTVVYPEQRSLNLTEGQYKIEVQAFRESSITLPPIDRKECVSVPASGFGGLFGFEREECFDVNIPSQVVSNALFAGGKQNHFILESELESARKIKLSGSVLPSPNSIEQLQENYILFESQRLGVDFE